MERKDFRKHFDFKTLTKLFFDIAEERYPTSDKINQHIEKAIRSIQANSFETLHIKITLLNALREMIKQVSPAFLYRSLQHRDDLYLCIVETSEDAEDKLEELEEAAISAKSPIND